MISKLDERIDQSDSKKSPHFAHSNFFSIAGNTRSNDPKTERVFSYLAPLIGLSLLPLLACIVFQIEVAPTIAVVCLINAVGSGADIHSAFVTWSQIPTGSVLRDKGFATYWRNP